MEITFLFLQFEEDEKAREDLETADELLNKASLKLNHCQAYHLTKCYSCPNDARNCKDKMSAPCGLLG